MPAVLCIHALLYERWRRAWIRDVINAATASRLRWSVPASVTLAQWVVESAWGAAVPPGSNNPFGIKAIGETAAENLIAERVACEHYRELVNYFADKDPTTRIMLESILAKEEEHANDMHDLLVAHEGRPMLASS